MALQEAALKKMGIAFRARYSTGKGCIKAQIEVRDTTGRDRSLQIGFRLPFDCTGWLWGDHLRAAREIDPTGSYRNWFELGPGRFCNVYPFSLVTGRRGGIGLGIPMNVPRVFRVSCEPGGLEIWFDVGLSGETKRFPGKASVSFVLYTCPAKWGFRAATRKYYDLYPQFFARRASRCGNWGLNPHCVRNPEDFAMRFGGAPLAWSKQHSFCSLIYNEPWGWWMPWEAVKEQGEKRPPPSYEETLSRLRQATLASPKTEAGWMLPYIPMRDIAQAVLNATPYDERGRYVFSALGWLGWTSLGSNTWVQYYPINPDPDVRPLPNRDSLTRKWVLEPYFRHARELGLDAGGAYIDSVSAGPVGLATLENYRRSHWSGAKQPLVFDPATRAVCQLYLFAAYDFLSRLSEDLHKQDKVLFCNMSAGYGLTFFGHLFDLIGREGHCEFYGVPYFENFRDSDEMLNYLRVLSGAKPASFYDYDYWRSWFGDPNRERRLRKCLFYGVFPGLPWASEAEAIEGSESMRALARKYFPAMERLAEAGWEPITGAVASERAVMVERYGDGRKHNLHFTLRNETSRELDFMLTVNLVEVGLTSSTESLRAEDLITGTPLRVTRRGSSVSMGIMLAENETLALAIGTPSDLARPHLSTASERLGLIRDIAVFNTKPSPERSIDLRPGWYADRQNSRGAYLIDEDPAAVDCRGRPVIRMKTRTQLDRAIYCSGPCDLRVKTGEQYELILRCRVSSGRSPDSGHSGLLISTGFSEYFGRLLENDWQQTEVPVTHPSQWTWLRVHIRVPEKAHRMFFRFTLRGENAVAWLADQRLAKHETVDVAVAELEQMSPPDDWLARQAQPRLAMLHHQLCHVTHYPTAEGVRSAGDLLERLKDELANKYPPTSEPENREAWQRLEDAVAQLGRAEQLLAGTEKQPSPP